MTETKKMSVKEFIELGLLQEVNRVLLHPMGLALEVLLEQDGSGTFSGIQDYRDDEEGMIFHESKFNDFDRRESTIKKAESAAKMFEKHREVREKKFGWHIQPAGIEKGVEHLIAKGVVK